MYPDWPVMANLFVPIIDAAAAEHPCTALPESVEAACASLCAVPPRAPTWELRECASGP